MATSIVCIGSRPGSAGRFGPGTGPGRNGCTRTAGLPWLPDVEVHDPAVVCCCCRRDDVSRLPALRGIGAVRLDGRGHLLSTANAGRVPHLHRTLVR